MLVKLHTAVMVAGFLALAGPASAQQKASPHDAAAVKKGKILFEMRGCASCHSFGEGEIAGPDLSGVTERRDQEWLTRWLKSTDEMLESDATAKKLLRKYKGIRMPNLRLSDDEVEHLLVYINSREADN